MKKIVFSTIMIVFISAMVSADPWKLNLNANLSTSLNTYSDNWIGGEAGSFTWGSQFLGIAERKLSEKVNTKTTLKLQFGQTEAQNKETKNWSVPQKSTDLIDGEELLRFATGKWADPFISARAISQFVDGSDSLKKRYVNPVEITEAIGMSRSLKKNELIDWSTRLGGAARQYIDRHKLDAATQTRSNNVTDDGGVEMDMNLNAMNKAKSISLLSDLRVYEALVSSKADEAKGTDSSDYWRYPHVKWENTLTLTFAKYLMLNVSAYAYYDKNIKDDARLKETLAAGFTYTFTK
jgi:hypothetical protein